MSAREEEQAGNKSEKLCIPPPPAPRVLGRSLSCFSVITTSELDGLDVLDSEPCQQVKESQPNSDTRRDDRAASGGSSVGKLEDNASEQKLDRLAGSRLEKPSLAANLMKGKSPIGTRILTSEEVNQRADDFIAGFLKQMRIERQESYEIYRQRIERSAG